MNHIGNIFPNIRCGARPLLAALLLGSLLACSGGGNQADNGGASPSADDPDPAGGGATVVTLSGDVLAAVPALAQLALHPAALPATADTLQALDTLISLPQTGLMLALDDASLATRVDPLSLEAQWLHMSACTGQTAVAPIVIVSDATRLQPLTSDDDVMRDLDGRAMATASDGAVLQSLLADLDGSLDSPGGAGFYLRSIMGRYLWSAAALAERDYPFACARDVDD